MITEGIEEAMNIGQNVIYEEYINYIKDELQMNKFDKTVMKHATYTCVDQSDGLRLCK